MRCARAFVRQLFYKLHIRSCQMSIAIAHYLHWALTCRIKLLSRYTVRTWITLYNQVDLTRPHALE